jgi:hypothetical protein
MSARDNLPVSGSVRLLRRTPLPKAISWTPVHYYPVHARCRSTQSYQEQDAPKSCIQARAVRRTSIIDMRTYEMLPTSSAFSCTVIRAPWPNIIRDTAGVQWADTSMHSWQELAQHQRSCIEGVPFLLWTSSQSLLRNCPVLCACSFWPLSA